MNKSESGINIVNTLSILVIFGYMIAMPMWMWWPPEVKPEVLAIINQMMGAWSIAFGGVLQYHFGSSKGAKDAAAAQRDTLSQMTSTVTATAATATGTGLGTAPTNGADEIKTWNDAVTANTRAAFEGYLAKYPNGVRAPDAKARIAQLP